MSSVVVGSVAARHHFSSFPRQSKDVDVFATTDHGLSSGDGFDVFSHPWLDSWIEDRCSGYATVDELYTIKLSHSYWELKNGSWDKHIFDMRWLKRNGAQLIPELHDTLYKVWEEKHGKKKTTLQMEKDEFFTDAVKREFDHDSLHRTVAFNDEAMYERILRDGSTVDVDPKKLWDLSHEDLVLLFREEIAATALERIMIPTNYRYSPGAAYRWSLRRTLTSLTKGKSARFIAENFEDFAIPDDYMSRHYARKDRLIKL